MMLECELELFSRVFLPANANESTRISLPETRIHGVGQGLQATHPALSSVSYTYVRTYVRVN